MECGVILDIEITGEGVYGRKSGLKLFNEAAK